MADPRAVGIRRRGRRTAVLGVLCVIALGGSPTACGEEEQPSDGPTALDVARLGKITQLSEKQYRTFERVYEAFADLERTDNTGLDFDVVVRDVRDACEAPVSGDPLLAPVLRSCAEAARFATSTVEVRACVGTLECADPYDSARARVQAYGRSLHASDAAVNATRLPRACKRLFLTEKSEYKEARRYDRAIATLQAAVRTASTGDDEIAAKRFVRVDRGDSSSSSSSSSSSELRRLRRHCRARS